MNLIERAKNICLSPAAEWLVIAPEVTQVPAIYTGYVMILAAIQPIASFIGLSVIGSGFFKLPILWGLTTAILGYVLTLAAVYLISLIINALAPNFSGEKNALQAFKLAAYSFTPAWLAGILQIIPMLGILALLAGLYSLYVLYLGTMPMMRVPKDKAVGYTAVVVLCSIVLMVVLGAIVGGVNAVGMRGLSPYSGLGTSGAIAASGLGADSTRNQQVAAAMATIAAEQQIAAAARQASTEPAQVTPPANAVSAANTVSAAAAIAAAAPIGTATEVVDQNQLKALLPATVGTLPRTGFQAEKTGMGAFMISKAQADYGDGQGSHVQIVITDMGGTQMIGMMAVWANIEEDKESDTGYEKTSKVGGRPVHETFQKNGSTGEYSVLVGQRFLVQANGSKIDMAALQGAVNGMELGKLDAMKSVGVKAAG